MNSLHFEDWFENKVLPALPDKAVVVLDNAKYHSRITDDSKKPTMKWRKAMIQEWLTGKNILYEQKDTKPILLQRVKEVNVPKKYALEEITKKYCQTSKKQIFFYQLVTRNLTLSS